MFPGPIDQIVVVAATPNRLLTAHVEWPRRKAVQNHWQTKIAAVVRLPQVHKFDGLVQERRNSIANALELRLSCTNPTKWPCVPTSGCLFNDCSLSPLGLHRAVWRSITGGCCRWQLHSCVSSWDGRGSRPPPWRCSMTSWSAICCHWDGPCMPTVNSVSDGMGIRIKYHNCSHLLANLFRHLDKIS